MPLTTATTALNRRPFRKDYLLHGLGAWYALFWTILALDPLDRGDWFIENLLAVGLIVVLVATYRRFPLSDLSYILITIFMTIHAIGAHYTYAEVPLGFWIQDLWNLDRNHFDRIAHFSFGLFMVYPIREIYIRRIHVKGIWTYYLPVSGILSMSGLFELLEALIVQIVDPELGTAYLGMQGDQWDAQKDMAVALAGGILTMVVTYANARLAVAHSQSRPVSLSKA